MATGGVVLQLPEWSMKPSVGAQLVPGGTPSTTPGDGCAPGIAQSTTKVHPVKIILPKSCIGKLPDLALDYGSLGNGLVALHLDRS